MNKRFFPSARSLLLPHHPQARLLLLSSNMWYLGAGLLGPLLAIFAERIGGSLLDASVTLSVYMVVTGLVYIFIGRVADGHGQKERLLVYGYALNALLTFGYIYVDSTEKLFLLQIGLGFAAALATPTWEALYSKYQDKKHGATAWGMVDGESSIIMGLALLAGGLIITYFSFEAVFILMGIIQTLATLTVLPLLNGHYLPPRSTPTQRKRFQSFVTRVENTTTRYAHATGRK